MHSSVSPPFAASRRAKTLLWLLGLVLLAFHFGLVFMENGRVHVSMDDYTRFEAKRPYQSRTLMAPVMRGLIEVYSMPAPKAFLTRLPTYISTPVLASFLTVVVVAFMVSCCCMVGITRKILPRAPQRQLAMGLYIAVLYLFFTLNPNVAFILPYDIPSLALSQACLLCILYGRWTWLYPLFVLGTLNRETSFLVVVFLAARAAMHPQLIRRTIPHVVALSALWIAIKICLHIAFSHLATDEGLRLSYNFGILAKPWQWLALLPVLTCFGLSLWSLRFRLPQPEWALTASVGFVMIFIVGQVIETRAFGDLMVYFAIGIAQWLTRERAESAATAEPESAAGPAAMAR